MNPTPSPSPSDKDAEIARLRGLLNESHVFVRDFMNKNPKYSSGYSGKVQDPWGVHDLFDRMNATLFPEAHAAEAMKQP